MTSLDTDIEAPSTMQVTGTRAMDICLVLLALPAVLPIFLALTAAVHLTSRGSAFFIQTRIGHYGKPFAMIKFRSMYEDAEDRRAELIRFSDRGGICIKIKNDPRVTPVGRFLRRWSLDELPQLINVLKGEMSLVGPRPALEDEVAQFPPRAKLRHLVRPGLTGLWQISGRADVSFDEMIAYDLHYVKHASFLRDCTILLQTLRAVLHGKGAY
jgi:lipopolysaccharide/colanic/teichoic acid biosynthesis glycosyltransferase